jgi:GT2 family glycosyltransferase
VNDPPSVTVVIPNWNGASHLSNCLSSLAELEFPRERLEVVVVDNGSTDRSLELLRSEYPWVERVELGENLGFAEASNRGAEAATTSCVAFLNNDMRVDPQWLKGLLTQYDPARRCVCVGGVVLNWEGDRIDFVDGWINFHAGADLDYRGVPFDEALIEDGRDLAFAAGASMLVQRDVFRSLGGFDSRYFAFLEDVDFCWRLWLAGYRVRLAARARSFHRGSATGARVPAHQLFLLRERNMLLTLLKNVSDENLPGLLAAAVLLLADRARLRSGSVRSAFEPGADDGAADEVVSRSGLAALHAVGDVLADLDGVLDERRRIQQLRRRDDEEIFELFRRPFAPSSRRSVYLEASLKLRTALCLDKLYTRQRILNVLVIARADERPLQDLARNASTYASVVFASTKPTGIIPGVSTTVIRRDAHLAGLLAQSDFVVVDGRAFVPALEKSMGLVAVDLRSGAGVDTELLRRGDVFFCRSEEQRDLLVRELELNGAQQCLVLPNDSAAQKIALRKLMWEPSRWRRASSSPTSVAVPEDLQLLLGLWRERYRHSHHGHRAIGALWQRLPLVLRRLIHRVVPTQR